MSLLLSRNAHLCFYQPRIPLSIAYLAFLFNPSREIVDAFAISSALILSSENGAGIRSAKQSVKNVYYSLAVSFRKAICYFKNQLVA
jgi:hypothetical protein